jgi:pimeloyl-ACP methyl ester carboxylesterase
MVKTVFARGVPHACDLTPPTETPYTLVFIHGWLLSRGYWQPVIQQLAATYQCLSYDLRGFGDSQPPGKAIASRFSRIASEAKAEPDVNAPEHLSHQVDHLAITAFHPSDNQSNPQGEAADSPYRPLAYAQDLAELLAQLHLQQVWLVGHSLGGSIALWTADLIPERVKGVICINSGGGIYLKEEFERFRSAGQQLVRLRPRWLCYLPLIDIMMTRMNVARPIARTWGRKRLLDLVMAHPEAAMGTLLESTTESEVHQLPQVIARLQQPVHFIAGANDDVMEPQYVRHLASFHPSFQCCGNNVTEIPDCGHMAMVEQPDLVAQEITAILDQHSDKCLS